jgi:hypothetical protein
MDGESTMVCAQRSNLKLAPCDSDWSFQLDVLDTAGADQFISMNEMYLKVVEPSAFSLTKPDTILNLLGWRRVRVGF